MNKTLKREERLKKARQKKILIASIFTVVVLGAAITLLFSLTGKGSQTNADGDNNVLDLTVLSMAVRNAEIDNILSTPENYEGRTVKIDGYYYAVHSELRNKMVHAIAVIAQDSCCPSVAFEFEKNSDTENYPEFETRATVIGELRLSDFGQGFYIAVDEMSW